MLCTVVFFLLTYSVHSVNCGVLEKHVIKYEGETVQLACFTDQHELAEWGVRTIFQRYLQRTLRGHDEYRRIYTSQYGLQRGFNFTRRYSVSRGDGYYNLTIKNLNISENGEYVCMRKSSTQLSVYVNTSLLLTYDSSSVIAGNDVTLPCRRSVVGPARWLYVKSELLPQDVIAKDVSIQSKYMNRATVAQTTEDYNLSLHNVQLNQSGFYICIEDGPLFFKTPILVTVLVNESTLESPLELTVFDGDPVNLPCRDRLGGTVRWSYTRSPGAPQNIIFDRNVVFSNYMNKVTVNNDHSSQYYDLSIHAAQLNDYGWYICYIEYEDGSSFIRPVVLTVKVDVSRFQERQVQWLSPVVGHNVTLPCRTNFSSAGLERWMYIASDNARQDVIASGGHVQMNDSQKRVEYNLTMLNIQLNETGWYICIGDGDETIMLPFFLTVHESEQSSINLVAVVVLAVSVVIGVGVCVVVIVMVIAKKFNRRLRGGNQTVENPVECVSLLPGILLERQIPFPEGVAGVTVSNGKSFVLGFNTENTIHQYDAEFNQLEPIIINGLSMDNNDRWYKTLVSCNDNLYVNDKQNVFRVHLPSKNVKPWPVVGDAYGLSVDGQGNVLVSCFADSTIKIYSSEGDFKSSIQLKKVSSPNHAVQFYEGLYVVSYDKPQYGVSLINQHGRIAKTDKNSFKTRPLHNPRWIVVINEKCILVADQDKNRVLLFNVLKSSLSDPRELNLPVSLATPCCMFVETSRDRLYIGEIGGEMRFLVFSGIISYLNQCSTVQESHRR